MKAEFVKTVVGGSYKTDLPQVAFFGRSNAGKSSVINSLADKKELAKTSKTPGKTLQANFYLVNNRFYLLDFPGYGYAKRPKKDRDKMVKRMFWYVENCYPRAVFIISDIKVGITDLDREMIEALKQNGHRVVVVANKADKLKTKEKEKKILSIEEEVPEVIPYSAKTKRGREELLSKIDDVCS